MKQMNKSRQQLADMFVAALQENKLPWRACWQGEKPYNATSRTPYRGVNRLLLSAVATDRGYSDPRWCTYLQAQKKGWQVMRGAKGVPVEYWACALHGTNKWLTWEEVRHMQENDPDQASRLELRCRISTVFNAEQIEGIDKLPTRETIVAEEEITDIRDTVLRNMRLAYRECGTRAYYSPGEDRVTLPPMQSFDNDYAFLCTFLHECGHATSHASRLDRSIVGLNVGDYAREELRAEIASAFASQEIGLPMEAAEQNEQLALHKAYIQSWIAELQKDPNELFAAIREADRICDYLLEMCELRERSATQETQAVQEAAVVQVYEAEM